MRRYILGCALALIFAQPAMTQKEINQFIKHKELRCPPEVNAWKLSQSELLPPAISKMDRAFKAMPWADYERIFVSQEFIKRGLWFMRQNRSALKQAEKHDHVPKAIITAIIGIESFYGERMGRSMRVLDVLSTLGFHYPRRSAFFQQELICYLNQNCQKSASHVALTGSYAGAFGMPQFMPCSYQRHAVSGSSRAADLIHSPTDSILSVAHYLRHRGGWNMHEPIVKAAHLQPEQRAALQDHALTLSAETCRQHALLCPAKAVKLWCPTQASCVWIYPNFMTIMKYNNSLSYALAVTRLAENLGYHAPT